MHRPKGYLCLRSRTQVLTKVFVFTMEKVFVFPMEKHVMASKVYHLG